RHHDQHDAEHAAAIADADTAASIALAHRAHPQPATPTAQPTPVPAAPTHRSEPPPAGEGDLEPQTAESLRLLRAAQAKPLEDALRSPPTGKPPAANRARPPSRASRPRR